jgi:hypothetical protein
VKAADRYRRQARTANELCLGRLLPLDQAIEELCQRRPAREQWQPTAAPHRATGERGDQESDRPFIAPQMVSRDGIEPPTRGFSKRSGPSGSTAEAIQVLGHEAEEEPPEPDEGPSDPPAGPSRLAPDPVDVALGDAIHRAARAEAWSTVEVLTAELRARREARTRVVSLEAERSRRGRR